MSKISLAIRNSAITSPTAYLGSVECHIVDAFCGLSEYWGVHDTSDISDCNRMRIFMLLVAEALDD